MSAILVTMGAGLFIISALAAIFPGRFFIRLVPGLILAGALSGLAGCTLGMISATASLVLPWWIPGGEIRIDVDALSAFFATPVFLIGGVSGIYAERYWPVDAPRSTWVRCFFGLLVGSLAIVMVAGNTILFLAAWETVTISSFLLVGTEHESAASRHASWLFLATSHVALLALFAIVAILHALTDSWSFAALPPGTGSLTAGRAIFALAVFGFGLKAGLMPFHIWLPAAHGAAPSHVSAVMSGVVIKMGIYGLVRVLSLFDAVPFSFGVILMVLGIVSSIMGVAFALAQHDLKRLLAYHSIENIGIIVTGLGVGFLARAHGVPGVAVLGFAGALLHVWNHGLFKSLLFLGAGSVIRATQTREIERMGGLARAMPSTAFAFLIGAVAICGLPPLNGFVSEWLLFVASLTNVTAPETDWSWLLVFGVAPALAFTGALALACFVKVFGAVFLGLARSEPAKDAHESPLSMRLAMVPLVVSCLLIGVFPRAVAPVLGRIAAAFVPGDSVSSFDELLTGLQVSAITIAAVVALAFGLVAMLSRRRAGGPTWDCGYAIAVPRAQYTASSLARLLTGIFAWVMPPVVNAPPRLRLFPRHAEFESHVPDTVLDRAVMPVLRHAARLSGFARHVQGGRVQVYIVSLGLTLVVLLVWGAL